MTIKFYNARNSLRFQRSVLPKIAYSKSSLLVMTAGKDSYVSSQVTEKVVNRMRRKCPNGGNNINYFHFNDAFHDILDERDDKAREQAINMIMKFLSKDLNHDKSL